MTYQAIKVGKYVIRHDLIARGGMAEVFRGKMVGAAGFEKHVALKRILPEYLDSPSFQRMFLAEAQIMASLVHANIVRVYDFFKDKDDVYLVMELIFGQNLRQILNRLRQHNQVLPIPFVLYIATEVSKALDYAHRKVDDKTRQPLKIVHRDISPQNIMVSFDGEIKIVDFGIAKFRAAAEKTATGVLKGKFGYMSPEQIEGLTLDHRSDIFSLGVVTFEALTGQKLFQADTEVQFVKMIESFKPPRTSSLRPEVSSELEEVLNKSIAKERAFRFQQAHEFGDALGKTLFNTYGGFNQVRCAEYLQKLFAPEFKEELARMSAPVEVVLSGEHEIEAEALPATGTEGPGETQVQKKPEETVAKVVPPPQPEEAHVSWHELIGDHDIRFKIALDPDVPWLVPEKKAQTAQKNVPAPPPPRAKEKEKKVESKSLFLRVWRDPKRRRRWLIIIALLALGVIWFASPEGEETADQQTPAEETTQPSTQQKTD